MSLTDIALAAAAGAFAYHVYAKVTQIEAALGEGTVVHVGASLDRAASDGDNEEGKFRFGFH